MATLAELQDRLTAYYAAEREILTNGQAYASATGSSDRSATRANLAQVQSMIRTLEQQVATHPDNTSSGGRLSHSQTVFGGRR
jgi:hypothetical protein